MPSFRTIAYLKKNNAEAFRKVFRQFVLMLKDMGLIEGETIGIDSFKIFAQNSLRNNYTQKKIDRHLEYIDNRIEEFEVALDKTDKEEEKEEDKEKENIKENSLSTDSGELFDFEDAWKKTFHRHKSPVS